MNSATSPAIRSAWLAEGLANVGACLIGLFVCILLGNFLPPKLIDPTWQLDVAASLINNGGYSLIGSLLILLGSYIDAANIKLIRRQALLRQLLCWVTVAYLLLIPLQITACVRGLDRANKSLQRESQFARQTAASLRSSIASSASLADLEARLRKFNVPVPVNLGRGESALPAIKQALLTRIQENEITLQRNLSQPLHKRYWPLLQQALRNMLGAFVLAFGFAALATPAGSSTTLLKRFQQTVQLLPFWPS